jgi:hypothetical protein
MKIELHEILIKDLVNDYADNKEEGVYGYSGKLNISGNLFIKTSNGMTLLIQSVKIFL